MLKHIQLSALAFLFAAPLYAQDAPETEVTEDAAPAEGAEVAEDATPTEGAEATEDAAAEGTEVADDAAPAEGTEVTEDAAPAEGAEVAEDTAPATPEVGLIEPGPIDVDPVEPEPTPSMNVSATAAPSAEREMGSIVIGLHAGPSISPFNDLELHGMPRLELGYNLGALGDRLEVFATGAYTQPPASGTIEDPRMPADTDYDLVQDEVTVGAGVLIRLFPLGTQLNPYGAVGPQVALLQSTINGDAGTPTGENVETRTEYGAFGALGAEFVLGPGAGFFQVGFSWSDLDAQITGDTNTGTISPALGYRLML